MLVLRPPGQIVADLTARGRAKATLVPATSRERLAACLPADYLSLVDLVGTQELAGDFILLHLADVLRETAGREHPNIDLGTIWWVIGTSGTGDAWLLRRTESNAAIAFLDHDQGTDAQAIDMGIDFMQWLQLADLMAQVEQAPGGTLTVSEVVSAMDGLATGLSQRYPYRLDL